MINFHTNMFASATRRLASSLLAIGFLLLGLAALVFVLKAVLVLIVAGIFVFGALFCFSTAIKMFYQLFKQNRGLGNNRGPFRDNVRPHDPNRHDF